MKSISQTVFFAIFTVISTFANASDVGAKLSLAMELKDGETTIGTPRIIVVSGEQGNIAVSPKTTVTEPRQQRDYRIAASPSLGAMGELVTAYEVTVISPASDSVAANTRTMKMKIKQKLGETIILQVPGANGEQPLQLTVKTDIVS